MPDSQIETNDPVNFNRQFRVQLRHGQTCGVPHERSPPADFIAYRHLVYNSKIDLLDYYVSQRRHGNAPEKAQYGESSCSEDLTGLHGSDAARRRPLQPWNPAVGGARQL